MNRISLFRTRIVVEDKVYLLAKDVRKALGCKSIEQLQGEYPEEQLHYDVSDAVNEIIMTAVKNSYGIK